MKPRILRPELFVLILAGILACQTDAKIPPSQRPQPDGRLFVSQAVENKIAQVDSALTDPYLKWMFSNCYPNTLDTTVHYGKDEDGSDRTFVYTGDIHAMWLRDSGAQVWPYVGLCASDESLRHLVAGVINCQFDLMATDPFANAFNDGPTGEGWHEDRTPMKPEVFERKWEIDSDCYPIRLAYGYWKATGDESIFGPKWLKAIRCALDTFKDQQRKDGRGSYRFERKTERATDTKGNGGWGNPVKPCGLIASSFRPSDDATTFEFLIPDNFFAVSCLRKAAEILSAVNKDEKTAAECTGLADEVEAAIREHAVVDHPKYGKIYAFEVDGFGNAYLMDDANVPSLLSLPYIADVPVDDPVYQNTRRFVWSEDNPWFFKGKAAEGIGGPHIGFDMVWPMSIMMKAFTSTDDGEILRCLDVLVNTDAGTGFMHESFNKDDPSDFTRSWFAWANTLFGELVVKLYDEGKVDLLNSVKRNK
jgi:meiotically up-regulated gene 157 (Mug157) protein